jgi:(1->4)-alpha-D-glucan 1-alpha-D-glucosylmutase
VALRARAVHRELFLYGEYAPLPAGEHVIAFIRTTDQDSLIVCVPRFSRRLTRGDAPWPIGSVWGDQTILVPAGRFRELLSDRDIVTHGDLRLAECFAIFPLALLIAKRGPAHADAERPAPAQPLESPAPVNQEVPAFRLIR